MLTNLSAAATPEEAALLAKHLTGSLSGDELHKAFDAASNQILISLGFGEFVSAFLSAVEGYHKGGVA